MINTVPPACKELPQGHQQFIDIVKMEARRRLVKDVHGVLTDLFRQIVSQLDTLGLPSGQCGGGLTQTQVAQSNRLEAFSAY